MSGIQGSPTGGRHTASAAGPRVSMPPMPALAGARLTAAAAVVVAAVVAVAAGAPAVLRAPLSFTAVALLCWESQRLMRQRGVDRLALIFGTLLTVPVIAGSVADALGLGLGRIVWAVLLAIGSGAVLTIAARTTAASRRTPAATRPGARSRNLTALAGGLVVAALAVGVLTTAPKVDPLELSLAGRSSGGTSVTVVVTTHDKAPGPLWLTARDAAGTDVAHLPVSIGADTSRTIRLQVPARDAVTIELTDQENSAPLRTLVVDR